MTTHIVSDVESIAGDVLLMKHGELIAHGSPEELMSRTAAADLEGVYMAYLGGE